MSGRSTPKRSNREIDKDDVCSDNSRSISKKNMLERPPASHWCPSSRYSSQSSHATFSSLENLNAATELMDKPSVISATVGKLRKTLSTLPEPPSFSLPRISPQDLSLRAPTIQPSYDPQNEQICFGMLKDIPIHINCVEDRRSIIVDEIGGGVVIFALLDLVFGHDQCSIFTRGASIATMSRKTHVALNSLSCAEHLKFNGIMPKSELSQRLVATISSGLPPPNLPCMMAMLIFGPRFISETLARELSRYRLFLQHPYPMPTNTPYENPQYLSMVGSSLPNGALLPPLLAEAPHRDTYQSARVDQDDEIDLATVIDNIYTPSDLKKVDIDKRIGATLTSHQIEAVSFVLSRERIEDSNLRSLWHLESFITGPPIYRHLITDLKSSTPDDMLGGILADGMGLGKTLTMIASIVASLSRAEDFATRKLSNNGEAQTSTIPVKSTLVIVPSTLLLDGWIDEINKHVEPDTLLCYKYHGPNRKLPSSESLAYHIVLTTYGTMVADYNRGGGVLRSFHWYRLILDEAHFIKNPRTKQFKAVTSLSASARWCMTGTPIQNSLDDLGSLIRFLNLPVLGDSATFQKHISGRTKMTYGIPRPDYRNLKLLLGSICLRRSTSAILTSLGVTFTEHRPPLSDAERKAYDELAVLCDRSIKAAVNGRAARKHQKTILTAVLRLRMFCNTGPAGIVDSKSEDDMEEEFRPDEVISLLQQSGEAVCVSCNSQILSMDTGEESEKQQVASTHKLKCQTCFKSDSGTDGVGNSTDDPSAVTSTDDPMEDVQMESSGSSALDQHTPDSVPYPSKLMALLKDIKEHYSQDKSIIFSFWRRSLDLVSKLFHEEGIAFGRIDGDVHPSKRKTVLTEFHDNPDVRVLLMTIGTGAVGLNNLSVASRVHILEPQWNPSVEDQAIGRVFRMGQSKNVCVVRYVMDKTIEEIIESRQFFKVQLALKGGLHSSDQKLSQSQQRIADLKALGKIIESTILTGRVG